MCVGGRSLRRTSRGILKGLSRSFAQPPTTRYQLEKSSPGATRRLGWGHRGGSSSTSSWPGILSGVAPGRRFPRPRRRRKADNQRCADRRIAPSAAERSAVQERDRGGRRPSGPPPRRRDEALAAERAGGRRRVDRRSRTRESGGSPRSSAPDTESGDRRKRSRAFLPERYLFELGRGADRGAVRRPTSASAARSNSDRTARIEGELCGQPSRRGRQCAKQWPARNIGLSMWD
jgi:hypothetical protein